MANDRGIALTNDPLWFKDAIIYELHVKTFLRFERRRKSVTFAE